MQCLLLYAANFVITSFGFLNMDGQRSANTAGSVILNTRYSRENYFLQEVKNVFDVKIQLHIYVHISYVN